VRSAYCDQLSQKPRWPCYLGGVRRDPATSQDNPWLGIPAEEYDAHMEAVGQAAALRQAFERVLGDARPARLAVLGCSTGRDLALVDPARTQVAVGVDVNPRYLELARARLSALGPRPHLVCGDVLSVELPEGPYDLVHAALLLEYVEPRALLRRIAAWLGPSGTCSLITQEPSPSLPAVSETPHASLRALAPHLTLRTADDVAAIAEEEGFALASRRMIKLPSGKILVSAIFDKARRRLERRRGRTRC
jgi:SAM-dependent methyltransferase